MTLNRKCFCEMYVFLAQSVLILPLIKQSLDLPIPCLWRYRKWKFCSINQGLPMLLKWQITVLRLSAPANEPSECERSFWKKCTRKKFLKKLLFVGQIWDNDDIVLFSKKDSVVVNTPTVCAEKKSILAMPERCDNLGLYGRTHHSNKQCHTSLTKTYRLDASSFNSCNHSFPRNGSQERRQNKIYCRKSRHMSPMQAWEGTQDTISAQS